jgi:hypothetical protein
MNVQCTQEPKEVFGVPVAQCLDPDGLVLSVGEERLRPQRRNDKPPGRVLEHALIHFLFPWAALAGSRS